MSHSDTYLLNLLCVATYCSYKAIFEVNYLNVKNSLRLTTFYRPLDILLLPFLQSILCTFKNKYHPLGIKLIFILLLLLTCCDSSYRTTVISCWWKLLLLLLLLLERKLKT